MGEGADRQEVHAGFGVRARGGADVAALHVGDDEQPGGARVRAGCGEGADALARQAVRLRPLFRAGELLARRK